MPHASHEFTKRRIAQECIKVFNEHGLQRITVEGLCKRAHVSKTQLYNIFEGKEDLIKHCVYMFEDELCAILERQLEKSNNVIEFFYNMLVLRLQKLEETSSFYQEAIAQLPSVSLYMKERRLYRTDIAVKLLRRGVVEGLILPNIDHKLTYEFMVNSMHAVSTSKHIADKDIIMLTNNCIYLMLRGICTLRGIEMLDEYVKKLSAQY